MYPEKNATLYYNEVKFFFKKKIRYHSYVQLSRLIHWACGIQMDGKCFPRVLTLMLLHVRDWIQIQDFG